MAQRIQHRQDTSANWSAANPVLAIGEFGVELHNSTGAVVAVRIGDGTTAWNALDRYATLADVTAAVSAIVDGAPGLLDTLNEIAAALGDDPNFVTTMAGDLAEQAEIVRNERMAVVKHGMHPALPRPDAPATYWVGDVEPLAAADYDLVRLKKNLLFGDDLLKKEAVAFWDTRLHDGGELLQDLSGKGHHLQMGSNHVARLMGEEGLLLPGQVTAYASAPNRAEYNITGDLDISVKVTRNNWTPATPEDFIAKGPGTTVSGGWAFRVTAAGKLLLVLSDGTNTISSEFGTIPGDNRAIWLRVTVDVNNGAGSYVARGFYRYDDNDPWIPLGSPVVGITTTTIAINTNDLRVGNRNSSNTFQGFIHRTIVKSGIEGITVFDADFTKQTPGATSFTEDALGATVTINGTSGADTNDPLWLPLADDEKPYLYLPGVLGDLAYTPNKTPITGDLQLEVTCYSDNWLVPSAASVGFLVGVDSSTDRGYNLNLLNTGALRFVSSTDGSATVNVTSSPHGVPNGTWVRFKVTLDVDNGAGGRTLTFFKSFDEGKTWTQISQHTLAGAATTWPSKWPITVGGFANGQYGTSSFIGRIRNVTVHNGINGPVVAEFDPSLSREPHRTFLDRLDNVWTISRSPSGRKAALVDRPMFQFSVDDYMETPDHSDLDLPTGGGTVVIAMRRSSLSPVTDAFLAKRGGAGSLDAGYLVYSIASDPRILTRIGNGVSGSISQIPDSLPQLGEVQVIALTVGNGIMTTYGQSSIGDSRATSITSIESIHELRIGRYSSSGDAFANMEFVGAAIFHRVLTDTEIEQVTRHFGWHGAPETILEEAVVAAVAGVYDQGGAGLLDLTGRGHNFRMGSAVGVDTNDPLMLPYDGKKYVHFSGVTDNYIKTSTGISGITGDVDVRWLGSFSTIPVTTISSLISQGNGTSVGGFSLRYTSTNNLIFMWSENTGGTGNRSINLGTPPGISAGKPIWLRVVLDVDNGAGGHNVTAYYSLSVDNPSPSDWVLFNAVTTAGVTSIHDNGNDIRIGVRTLGDPFIGNVYRAEVRNGVDGPVTVSFNANSAVEPYDTVAGGAGETWNFMRSTTGRKLTVIDQNLLLFGTDDYAETPDDDELDFGATDPFTVLVLARTYFSETSAVFTKKNSLALPSGWYLRTLVNRSVSFTISDGVIQPVLTSPNDSLPLGVREKLVGVRDVAQDKILSSVGVITSEREDTTTTTLASTVPVRIGASGAGADFFSGEVMGVAIVRRALSPAEMTQLANELITANADRTKRVLSRPSSRSYLEA